MAFLTILFRDASQEPKIYYGECNLACITFKALNLSDEIQPLTNKDVEKLNKTYGTFILVNPNSFQIPSNYYYSTEENGVVCIASETGKEVYGLKNLLNINKKILKEINKDFCVETKVFWLLTSIFYRLLTSIFYNLIHCINEAKLSSL